MYETAHLAPLQVKNKKCERELKDGKVYVPVLVRVCVWTVKEMDMNGGCFTDIL